MVMQVIGWILLIILIAFGVFMAGAIFGVLATLSVDKDKYLELKEEWDRYEKDEEDHSGR